MCDRLNPRKTLNAFFLSFLIHTIDTHSFFYCLFIIQGLFDMTMEAYSMV